MHRPSNDPERVPDKNLGFSLLSHYEDFRRSFQIQSEMIASVVFISLFRLGEAENGNNLGRSSKRNFHI
jgi:hypothetical protein